MRNALLHALNFGGALAMSIALETLLLLRLAVASADWKLLSGLLTSTFMIYVSNCAVATLVYIASLFRRRDARGAEIRIGRQLAPSFWLGAACGACSVAPAFVWIYLSIHFAPKLSSLSPSWVRAMAILSVLCFTILLPMIAGRVARGCLAEPTGNFCSCCGYDLRASPDRCPECGTPASREAESGSPVK